MEAPGLFVCHFAVSPNITQSRGSLSAAPPALQQNGLQAPLRAAVFAVDCLSSRAHARYSTEFQCKSFSHPRGAGDLSSDALNV